MSLGIPSHIITPSQISSSRQDSVLLTRIATGREKHEEGEAGAPEQRVERSPHRVEPSLGAQQGEEEGSRRRSKADKTYGFWVRAHRLSLRGHRHGPGC